MGEIAFIGDTSGDIEALEAVGVYDEEIGAQILENIADIA